MKETIIQISRKFTDKKLEELRRQFEAALASSNYKEDITLVTTGSYGRGEASEESDLDWFLIFSEDLDPKEAICQEIQKITDIVSSQIKKSEGDTKTFGPEATVRIREMHENIGGKNDSNDNLTRRMLFLLEGNWLYNERKFKMYRKTLLEKYIKEDASSEQLPRFFLNDLIRYYRTIATDFEFKTAEDGKSWGLRNIKLRFSRKLLYFGGVIVVAEMDQLNRDEKIDRAIELFDMDALTRIEKLGGNSCNTHKLLEHYESFLNKISDSNIRSTLEDVDKNNRMENMIYRELRQSSIDFSETLHDWLNEKYSGHPIHHALVF